MCRNLGEPVRSNEVADEAEEVTMLYVVRVVGPANSRGVDRVMPVEDKRSTRSGWHFIAKRMIYLCYAQK